MKKITLVFLILLISQLNFAQGIIWQEDFESNTIPSGWTTANVPGGSGNTDWTFGTGDFPWTDYTDWNLGNKAAIFSDYTPDETSHNDRMLLMTQGVDVTGFVNLKIEMQVSLRTSGSYGAGALSVLIFNQDSGGWLNLAYYDSDIINSSNIEINLQSFLEAHPAIDKTNIKIAFRYDDLGHGITYGAGIGWVKITGNPPNDDCSNAIEMGTLPFEASQYMLGATTTNVLNVCSTYDHPDGVWYTFVADHSWKVFVGLSTTMMNDYSFEIYSGSCGNLSCVDLVDEGTRYAWFNAVQGTRYYINVGDPYVQNYETSDAWFELHVIYTPPSNDACSDATEVTHFPFSETISMNGTTNNDGFINNCSNGMNDGVWYEFTAPVDGQINITALSDQFDAQIALFTGNCTNLSCITTVDRESAGTTERLTYYVGGGEHYLVNIGHYSNTEDVQEEGDMDVNIFYTPVYNSVCSGARELTCGESVFGDTFQTEVSNLTICDSDNSYGVWYRISPPNGGVVTLEILSDHHFTKSFYKGSCDNLTCYFSEFWDDYFEFETVPNEDIYLYIHSDQLNQSTFSIHYNCVPPQNDEATGAIELSVNDPGTTCTSPTMVYNSNGVTDSSSINGTPSCGNYAGGDSWYKFIAPASGGIKINRPNTGDWGAMGYAIYDSPTSTTALTCSYIASSNTNTESTPYTDLISGNYYWLRLWEWNNNDFGSVGICLEATNTTGYDDLSKMGISLYPNPAKDHLQIQSLNKINVIEIYNMIGQLVWHQIPDLNNINLDINRFPKGNYVIKIQSNNQIGTYKLIKE